MPVPGVWPDGFWDWLSGDDEKKPNGALGIPKTPLEQMTPNHSSMGEFVYDWWRNSPSTLIMFDNDRKRRESSRPSGPLESIPGAFFAAIPEESRDNPLEMFWYNPQAYLEAGGAARRNVMRNPVFGPPLRVIGNELSAASDAFDSVTRLFMTPTPGDMGLSPYEHILSIPHGIQDYGWEPEAPQNIWEQPSLIHQFTDVGRQLQSWPGAIGQMRDDYREARDPATYGYDAATMPGQAQIYAPLAAYGTGAFWDASDPRTEYARIMGSFAGREQEIAGLQGQVDLLDALKSAEFDTGVNMTAAEMGLESALLQNQIAGLESQTPADWIYENVNPARMLAFDMIADPTIFVGMAADIVGVTPYMRRMARNMRAAQISPEDARFNLRRGMSRVGNDFGPTVNTAPIPDAGMREFFNEHVMLGPGEGRPDLGLYEFQWYEPQTIAKRLDPNWKPPLQMQRELAINAFSMKAEQARSWLEAGETYLGNPFGQSEFDNHIDFLHKMLADDLHDIDLELRAAGGPQSNPYLPDWTLDLQGSMNAMGPEQRTRVQSLLEISESDPASFNFRQHRLAGAGADQVSSRFNPFGKTPGRMSIEAADTFDRFTTTLLSASGGDPRALEEMLTYTMGDPQSLITGIPAEYVPSMAAQADSRGLIQFGAGAIGSEELANIYPIISMADGPLIRSKALRVQADDFDPQAFKASADQLFFEAASSYYGYERGGMGAGIINAQNQLAIESFLNTRPGAWIRNSLNAELTRRADYLNSMLPLDEIQNAILARGGGAAPAARIAEGMGGEVTRDAWSGWRWFGGDDVNRSIFRADPLLDRLPERTLYGTGTRTSEAMPFMEWADNLGIDPDDFDKYRTDYWDWLDENPGTITETFQTVEGTKKVDPPNPLAWLSETGGSIWTGATTLPGTGGRIGFGEAAHFARSYFAGQERAITSMYDDMLAPLVRGAGDLFSDPGSMDLVEDILRSGVRESDRSGIANRLSDIFDVMGEMPGQAAGWRDEAADWLGGSVLPTYDNMMSAANKTALDAGRFVMLEPSMQRNIDRWLAPISMFTYFPSRTMLNWAKRTPTNPAPLNRFLSVGAYSEQRMEQENLPSRYGSMMPLGGGQQGGYWATNDPSALTYPYNIMQGNEYADLEDSETTGELIVNAMSRVGLNPTPMVQALLSPRTADFRSYIPFGKSLNYLMQSVGNDSLAGIFDDKYQAGREGRTGVNQVFGGNVSREEGAWGLDVLWQEKYGEEALPYQRESATGVADWFKRRTAQLQALPQITRNLFGLGVYYVEPGERARMDAGKERESLIPGNESVPTGHWGPYNEWMRQNPEWDVYEAAGSLWPQPTDPRPDQTQRPGYNIWSRDNRPPLPTTGQMIDMSSIPLPQGVPIESAAEIDTAIDTYESYTDYPSVPRATSEGFREYVFDQYPFTDEAKDFLRTVPVFYNPDRLGRSFYTHYDSSLSDWNVENRFGEKVAAQERIPAGGIWLGDMSEEVLMHEYAHAYDFNIIRPNLAPENLSSERIAALSQEERDAYYAQVDEGRMFDEAFTQAIMRIHESPVWAKGEEKFPTSSDPERMQQIWDAAVGYAEGEEAYSSTEFGLESGNWHTRSEYFATIGGMIGGDLEVLPEFLRPFYTDIFEPTPDWDYSTDTPMPYTRHRSNLFYSGEQFDPPAGLSRASEEANTALYFMRAPGSEQPFYIGQTKYPSERYSAHIEDINEYGLDHSKTREIARLLRGGQYPEMQVFDWRAGDPKQMENPDDPADLYEMLWIGYFVHQVGVPLHEFGNESVPSREKWESYVERAGLTVDELPRLWAEQTEQSVPVAFAEGDVPSVNVSPYSSLGFGGYLRSSPDSMQDRVVTDPDAREREIMGQFFETIDFSVIPGIGEEIGGRMRKAYSSWEDLALTNAEELSKIKGISESGAQSIIDMAGLTLDFQEEPRIDAEVVQQYNVLMGQLSPDSDAPPPANRPYTWRQMVGTVAGDRRVGGSVDAAGIRSWADVLATGAEGLDELDFVGPTRAGKLLDYAAGIPDVANQRGLVSWEQLLAGGIAPTVTSDSGSTVVAGSTTTADTGDDLTPIVTERGQKFRSIQGPSTWRDTLIDSPGVGEGNIDALMAAGADASANWQGVIDLGMEAIDALPGFGPARTEDAYNYALQQVASGGSSFERGLIPQSQIFGGATGGQTVSRGGAESDEQTVSPQVDWNDIAQVDGVGEVIAARLHAAGISTREDVQRAGGEWLDQNIEGLGPVITGRLMSWANTPPEAEAVSWLFDLGNRGISALDQRFDGRLGDYWDKFVGSRERNSASAWASAGKTSTSTSTSRGSASGGAIELTEEQEALAALTWQDLPAGERSWWKELPFPKVLPHPEYVDFVDEGGVWHINWKHEDAPEGEPLPSYVTGVTAEGSWEIDYDQIVSSTRAQRMRDHWGIQDPVERVQEAGGLPIPEGPRDDLEPLKGIGPKSEMRLYMAGYMTIEDIASAKPEELAGAVSGFGKTSATNAIMEARRTLGQFDMGVFVEADGSTEGGEGDVDWESVVGELEGRVSAEIEKELADVRSQVVSEMQEQYGALSEEELAAIAGEIEARILSLIEGQP